MKKWSNFKKTMIISAIVSTFFTLFFLILYKKLGENLFKSLSITFLTIAFHFDIRLLVGNIIPLFKNKINVDSPYFNLNKFEKFLYKKLKIKNWKGKVPTYSPDEYDVKNNEIDKIIRNMCNSELIHTINAVISYIPLFFILWFGSPMIFILTSVLASLFDLQFVVVQRFNRDRLIKIRKRYYNKYNGEI